MAVNVKVFYEPNTNEYEVRYNYNINNGVFYIYITDKVWQQ